MIPPQHQKPPQAPPLFTGTKESIISDSKAMCAVTRGLLDKLVSEISLDDANFNNTIVPQIHDENKASNAHILGFYQYVSPNAELRAASTEAEALLDDFSIEMGMREDVFKLVDAVYSRRETEKLDGESLRFIEKERKAFIKNGLSLPAGAVRDRFKEIKKRLSTLGIEFNKRLTEENGGVWLTAEELDGVPKNVVDNLEKGVGENEGKLKLTFKYTDIFPSLKFATNPETRRRIFVANENKCNDNVALFKETISLRDEAARMLGYPDHATMVIEDKMTKTPKLVHEFLGDLRSRLADGGRKEIDHLLELKKQDVESRGIQFDNKYFLWDHRYYDRLMIEKEYSIDENLIAEYFPLQSTIAGMLKIFEELMGFSFHELDATERSRLSPTGDGKDISWHEDVIIFSVWNDASEGDGFVGYLYLDLHPRAGKYGHAANFNLQSGFVKEDGSRQYPATALVCNFSKPTATRPSLLKHDEVVTLFHELGHGIHDLAGRVKYSRFHGTNTVGDFVEAPSQMLENWCWTPEVLKRLSKHVETGEPIPEDLIKKLISTKHVNGALANLRQLHFGIFDMTVHTPKSHADIEKLDTSKTYNELRASICHLQGPDSLGENRYENPLVSHYITEISNESLLTGYDVHSDWGHGEATFGHLMGGYDAGYYGYLSSQVYSTDMFYSVFKNDPMNAAEGRRYRHTVLEKGGSQDEMKTLEQFLGRKPNSEAFYHELGIPSA
ncbi:Thimet-like oligopeptidase [Ceratocystis fimbriata CBS 114723]|uniref:Thimet-like oligopeptidase n=1 Tax=Ceratocystis fimbriata CBS 114723 TaxID=1035309 RepID=A0A2C5X2B9_9PEZI|nr:Thimet-like oligopeptidase [Ceratocystis fimbriata CBS 114723]